MWETPQRDSSPWTPQNKFQRNLNEKKIIHENDIWKMSAILFWTKCVHCIYLLFHTSKLVISFVHFANIVFQMFANPFIGITAIYKFLWMIPHQTGCVLRISLFNSLWPSNLGQHWFRQWLVAWRHQAIAWTNVDLSSVRWSGIRHQGQFHMKCSRYVSLICIWKWLI